MITEGILSFIFSLVRFVFEFLPDVTWSVDSGAAGYFISIIQVVSYMLPVDTVMTIVGITLDLLLFRILVSVFRTIWDLIPIL